MSYDTWQCHDRLFYFRLEAITNLVLRGKWFKASKGLKLFDYELKPKF